MRDETPCCTSNLISDTPRNVLSFSKAIDVVRIVLPHLTMNTFPDSLGEVRRPIEVERTTGAPDEGCSEAENQKQAPQNNRNSGPGRLERGAKQHEAAENSQRQNLVDGAPALPKLRPGIG